MAYVRLQKGKMDFTKRPIQRGYTNRILRVDVASGKIAAPELDPRVRDYFLGGRSLGLYLLHKATTSKTKASDPENPLIIANGPLGGIPQFPGTAKAMAISLSPLTGIPGVSNFGGHFGAYLKYAGFDALEVIGKAARSVMIVIDGYAGKVTLEDAPADDEAFDLERDLVERFTAAGYNKRHIAFLSTGIGAANTTYGCINSHYYDVTKPVEGGKGLFRVKQAGRTGIGTVMSDKKIQAVVVLADNPHGENPYGAADWERVKRAGARLHKVVREVDPQSLKMSRKGSAGLITFMSKDEYQSLPVRNFQGGSDPRAEQICGKYYAEHLFDHRGNDGCFPGCNLQCTKGGCVTLKSGTHAGRRVWVDGPEYETAAGFGSNLGIWNAEFIMEANWHCDNYGIDTITTAGGMAFLMECFQRGYLTAEDGEGLVLSWGDEASALEFIHRLAHGETDIARTAGKGIKKLDGLGLREICRAAREKTSGRISRSSPCRPRGCRSHFTGRIGRSPCRDLTQPPAISAPIMLRHGLLKRICWALSRHSRIKPAPWSTTRGCVSGTIIWACANFHGSMCLIQNPPARTGVDIYINPASQEIYADFYNGVLGTNLQWEEIFAQTDRDINLQRVLNVLQYGRETGCHDWIPDRAIGPTDDLLYEAEADYNNQDLAERLGAHSEELSGMTTTQKRELLMERRKEQLRLLIDAYYQERGWNSCGIPMPETLKQLGLWEFLNEEARSVLTSLTS